MRALLLAALVALPASAVAGSATLSWVAPTERTDGSPLTDLAGFRIYYGTAPSSLPNMVALDNPGLLSYAVEDLPDGTWYFAATAVDSIGLESMFSNIASKLIEDGDPGELPGKPVIDVTWSETPVVFPPALIVIDPAVMCGQPVQFAQLAFHPPTDTDIVIRSGPCAIVEFGSVPDSALIYTCDATPGETLAACYMRTGGWSFRPAADFR